MRYQFDRFELDDARGRLLDCEADAEIALRPQAFTVLGYLLQRAPDLVERTELLNAVWGHTALSPSGIAQVIREIRRVLGDDAAAPGILATRHGKGYQIVTPVARLSAARSASAAPASVPEHSVAVGTGAPPTMRWVVLSLAVAGLLPVLALVVSLWLTKGPDAERQPGSVHTLARDLPDDPRARAAWQAGRQARAMLERRAAIDAFDNALEQAPNETTVRLDLAQAWLEFGQHGRARAVLAQPALQQSMLSQSERLRLRSLLALIDGHSGIAVEALASLAGFFPDALEVQYALFDAQRRDGLTERARQTLQRIRRLVGQRAESPRLLLAEAELFLTRGAFDRARDKALAARQAGPPQARGIAGFTALVLSRVALAEDRPGRAWQLAEQAWSTLRALDDPAGQAEAGVVKLLAAARMSNAPPVDAEALCTLAGDPTMPLVDGSCHWARAQEADASRDVRTALEHFDRAGALLQRAGRPDLAAESQLAAAEAVNRQGRLDDVVRLVSGVAGDFARSGNVWGRARAARRLGHALRALGRLEEAARAFQEAQLHYASLDRPLDVGVVLIAASEVERARGRLDAYDAFSGQAAEVLRGLNDDRAGAWLALAAGREAQRCGELGSALVLLDRAAAQLDPRHDVDLRAEVLGRIARIQIEQLELGDANAALSRARALPGLSLQARQRLDRVAARLAVVEGRYADAQSRALELLGQARDIELPLLANRAKLLLAIALSESGRWQAASLLLRELEREVSLEHDAALFADIVLTHARAAMHEGQPDVARHELARLDGLDLWRVDVGLELRARQLEAELLEFTYAVERLIELRSRAAAAGYRLTAMEADVARVHKLREAGDRSGGDLLARTIRTEAQALGAQSVIDGIEPPRQRSVREQR